LLRKVWCADPLACPRCAGPIRIISFIENTYVIEKTLRHLKLWDVPERPPPPRPSTTLEYDADYIAWEAAGGLFDGIDRSLRRIAPTAIAKQNRAATAKVCPAAD